jgi:hypothetical protein
MAIPAVLADGVVGGVQPGVGSKLPYSQKFALAGSPRLVGGNKRETRLFPVTGMAQPMDFCLFIGCPGGSPCVT